MDGRNGTPGAPKMRKASRDELGEEAAAPSPSPAAAASPLLFPTSTAAAAAEEGGCSLEYVRRELEGARTRLRNAANAATRWDLSAGTAGDGAIESTTIQALLLDTENALHTLRGARHGRSVPCFRPVRSADCSHFFRLARRGLNSAPSAQSTTLRIAPAPRARRRRRRRGGRREARSRTTSVPWRGAVERMVRPFHLLRSPGMSVLARPRYDSPLSLQVKLMRWRLGRGAEMSRVRDHHSPSLMSFSDVVTVVLNAPRRLGRGGAPDRRAHRERA